MALQHIGFGNFYESLGISNEAIRHFHEALLLLTSKKDTSQIYVRNHLGRIHLDIKQFKVAKEHLEASLNLNKQLNFKKGEAQTFALLGSVYEKTNDYEKALECQFKSMELFEKLDDSSGLALIYENLGSIYEDQERFDLAHAYFKKAFEYVSDHHTDRKINILNNLGDVNRKNGKLREALSYTEEARDEAISTQNNHQLESALKDLAKTYALLGDFDRAYDLVNESNALNEKILSLKNIQQLNTLQVLYGVKERETEINLLTKQNEVNKARQTLLLVGIVALILVSVTIGVYFKKRKKHELKLQEYKQQLLQADLDRKIVEEENLQREITLKVSSLSNYSLHLAHKNKMLSDIAHVLKNMKDREHVNVKSKLGELVKEINYDLEKEHEWTEFMRFFEQIHPDFFRNLTEGSDSEFSPAELRLCMLLRLNLSTKEIASILRVTPDSIRIARYRLRKKLPLEKNDDLQTYIFQI